MSDITRLLFETNAFVAAPADQPFWYTSGLFGPYYINTHYLFGSKDEATELLAVIEAASAPDMRSRFGQIVGEKTRTQYENHPIYRRVIDDMVVLTKGKSWQYVSGGERRDFFFSIELARKLGLPHLFIFKDEEVWLSETVDEEARQPGMLSGDVLHVADLITKASSYERAWIPALEKHGLKIKDTIAGVDRAQGGKKILEAKGIAVDVLATIDAALFKEAVALGKIDEKQEMSLSRYADDERGFVKRFLEEHPDFLEKEEKKDEKTKERVERLRAML